jgi:peptide/nickel transport system permease protein
LALNTLELTLIAQIVSLAISIILGVIAAVKQNTLFDNVLSSLSLFGYAMPIFWLALLMILTFSLNLNWFPTSGYSTIGIPFSLVDHLRHLALPISTMVIHGWAYQFRLVRSSMIEVLNKPYIITARSKGLSERIVIYKHALRNALLPVVTVVGLTLGFLLGGAAIIETIFAWPGLGRFIVNSAYTRDYPAIMGTSMIIAIMVLLSNLCTDIAYSIIDPRVKY